MTSAESVSSSESAASSGDVLPPVVVITGPTGSGKTDLAIALAKRFNGEIVNADSMQVFRYMDVCKTVMCSSTFCTHQWKRFLQKKIRGNVPFGLPSGRGGPATARLGGDDGRRGCREMNNFQLISYAFPPRGIPCAGLWE